MGFTPQQLQQIEGVLASLLQHIQGLLAPLATTAQLRNELRSVEKLW